MSILLVDPTAAGSETVGSAYSIVPVSRIGLARRWS
jgi:hypothetical protein